MTNHDLLIALADELAEGGQVLGYSIEILSDPNLPPELADAAAEDYRAFTARVAGAAQALNLVQLQEIIGSIDLNLSQFIQLEKQSQHSKNAAALLTRWPAEFSRLLHDPANETIELEFRSFLGNADWPLMTENNLIDSLISLIKSFSVSTDKTALHADEEELIEPGLSDVSVTIPDDISPKLLSTFQVELPQNTAELSQRIQKLFEKNAKSEDISEARRVAHTLKGAANIVGVTGIANVTHFLEDILEALINKSVLPSRDLADALMEAADCLEIMSEAALGISEPPDQALHVLNSLLDWRRRFIADEVEGLEPIEATPEQTEEPGNSPAQQVDTRVKENKPENLSVLPNQSAILDKLLDIAGELSSSNLLTQGQLQGAVENAESMTRIYGRLRSNMGLLQDLVFSQGLRKSFVEAGRVDAGLEHSFDPLEMDQYNELHSIANLMTELMDDIGDISKSMMSQMAYMRELLSQQDQLDKELDQSITAERLVPIRTILPRMQRSVRQTCRMLDKKAELTVKGEDLSIDRSILNAIVDPLLHMLRNAVDHGVEHPQQRVALNKTETASISVEFERTGNNFLITCKDDGRGIDTVAVKNKALKLGLIRPEQILGESALHELILLPGFSTKSDADQVSGRGVGMDIVAKNLAEQRGSISIRSRQGQGTEFRMTVPQTLLKMHVVLLRSGEFRFGILSGSFDQIVTIPADRIVDDDSYVEFNDEVYEVRSLSETLGITGGYTGSRSGNMTAILVRDEEIKVAALTDEAVGSGELVIKKIGHYFPRIGGMIGTVLTEDGTPVPVFDVMEILRRPSQVVTDYLQKQIAQPVVPAVNILIVDDSSSARRSMSQVVRDAGYDVRTAIDGIEAISLIEELAPDLVLTDLEMPKMNGLELTAHLRATESTRHLPIVMVTSRSTQKHRDQALSSGVDSYITKPFTNDDLVYEMHNLLTR